MPSAISFEDGMTQIPDDASDEETSGALSQGAVPMPATAPKQAARAGVGDPRFFAPMSPVTSKPASSANTVNPRFLTTIPSPSSGRSTGPNNAVQNPSASALSMSLFYAARQNPGQYARLLHFQDLTGIPPIVSAGNETQIQQAVNATRIDPRLFTTIAPNIAAWASHPDNAAVSGVDEILRLGRIEQNAAAMRAAPSLNAFLNRNGNGAIPTSADDLQVQAWKRVSGFWQAMGKGAPKPVDSLVDDANQELARQHAGDSAYRATPRPEPTTIAEEAQQATTPQTLHVYTPAAPTVAPLPAAPTPDMQVPGVMQTLAPGLTDFASSIWHNIVGGESDSQRETREAYEWATAGQSHESGNVQRARATALSLVQAPLFTAEDIERHLGTNFTSEQMAKALSAQDAIRAGRTTPDQLDFETRNLYNQLETGTQAVRASLPTMFAASGVDIPAPVVESALDFTGGMLSPSNVAMGAVLPESKVVSGLFALQGAYGAYQSAVAVHKAYQSGDKDTAAKLATTAALNFLMAGLAGSHASSGVTDGLGYEQGASDGLNEGAREAMGGSVATEPDAGAAPGTDTFFGNLSQAMAEAADSKLRGRAPERFYQALQAIFQGHDSLQIPVEQFNDYFKGKSIDPAAVAENIGATNHAEAMNSGGNVKVLTEDFLSKVDSSDQQGLLPDVADAASGMTLRQHQAFQQWLVEGGPAKLQAELAQSDSETAATPEWQATQEDLRQQYSDAGQTAEDAEAMATRDANVYGNLARKIGMQPAEMLGLYAKQYEWGAPAYISRNEFFLADKATEEDNAINASTRIVPGDERSAPIVAISPNAYAYLRKQVPGLRKVHWNGIYFHPGSLDRLEEIIEQTSGGLSADAKTSVKALLKTLRDNPSKSMGTILIRDGLSPWDEAVTAGEERMHDFQKTRPVSNDWLDKYSIAKERAEQEMARQGYKREQWPLEISAKIMAGNKIWLSARNVKQLRRAYRQALVDRWGVSALQELPDLKGSRRRLNSHYGL